MDNSDPWAQYYRRRRDTLVEEAHKRRPPVSGAPALVWHIALWPQSKQALHDSLEGDDPQDARSEAEYNRKFKSWIQDINSSIRKIQDLDDRKNLKFPEEGTIGLSKDPSGLYLAYRQSAEFSIIWREMDIDVIIETQYDFVMFTFLLDLSENRELLSRLQQSGDTTHPLSEIAEALEAVRTDARMHAAANMNTASPSAGLPSTADLAAGISPELTDRLFKGFWEGHFRKAALYRAGLEVNKPLFPGEAFAKFFGLVLDVDECQNQDGLNDAEYTNMAHSVLRSHWPFIKQANGNADDRDFVACSMMDKRAIYVTAMGAKSGGTETPEPNSISPDDVYFVDVQEVNYIVLVKPQPDILETGRLIEQVNMLGTLRLFALKELRLLRRLGTFVRLYGHRVDEITRQFSSILQDDPLVLYGNGLTTSATASDEEAFRRFMDTLGSETFGDDEQVSNYILNTSNIRLLQVGLCIIESKLYEHSSSFTGGVQFRISRSKFYVRLFKSRLPDLKISEIDPYQSYTVFINRRLFSTFDYISDIGVRVTSLQTRLHAVLESIQSKALVDLTVNIQRLSEYTAKQTASLLYIQEYSRKQNQQENWQTTILGLIAIFAFLGQALSALVWLSTGKEEIGAAIAYPSAALFVLIAYVVWRKRYPNSIFPATEIPPNTDGKE